MLRHTEINLDIVTWTRLLNHAVPSSVGPNPDSASSMSITVTPEPPYCNEGGHKHKHSPMHPSEGIESIDESPPMSPLTSHSGDSTPMSPFTPNALIHMSSSEKGEAAPMNGELPPPMPISEDDLVQTNRVNDHPIIPPPREFLGSVEDLAARRRASEGSFAIFPLPVVAGAAGSVVFPDASRNVPSGGSEARPNQQQQPQYRDSHHIHQQQQQQQQQRHHHQSSQHGSLVRICLAYRGGGGIMCALCFTSVWEGG